MPQKGYKEAIKEQMDFIALRFDSRKVCFLGQQVADQDFYGTLTDVPLAYRLEMPVAEELQLGMSIGMAIRGVTVVSIFQRMDFLPRAMDQIVNHLNLHPCRLLIRVTVGSKTPLDTGPQHSKNLVKLFKEACAFPVRDCLTISDIYQNYQDFYESYDKPMMIVEHQDLYGTKGEYEKRRIDSFYR